MPAPPLLTKDNLMKQTPSTFFVASMGILLVAGLLYSGIRKSRSMLEERLLNDEGLMPPVNSELDLPKRHTIREYFAYVDVTDIPYPPHPRNTTDKWHSTGTSPEELIQLM